MLPALLLTGAALCLALLRLAAYRSQLLDMARVLEETPVESNLRLTVHMPGKAVRRLCGAVNARIEAGRQQRLALQRGEQELKYTMACISHDIRTPLAGALGYLQLLEGAPAHREEYLAIVAERLAELERLLEELFLYTRLRSGGAVLNCRVTSALLPLYDALAGAYPQLSAAGIEPVLTCPQVMNVEADPEALARIYRNLIANALRHGGAGLSVRAEGDTVVFSNPLGAGPPPDPERLFDRFYTANPARSKSGAGLGLSIVRELMEQMGGRVTARMEDGMLCITLKFAQEAKQDGIQHTAQPDHTAH